MQCFVNMLNSDNNLVQHIALRCTSQAYTNMGKNVVYIGRVLGLPRWYNECASSIVVKLSKCLKDENDDKCFYM